MNKLLLVVFLVGLLQWTQVYSQDYESEESFESDEELERSWWSSILKNSFEVLKKSVKVNPLNCNGPTCSTCLSASIPKVLSKQGCFTMTYGQGNGNVNLNLNLDNKPIWQTNFNAGRPVPSCTNLPTPIKQVCVQDFQVNLPNGQGNICFTLAFKTYSFGVRYCVNVNGRHFTPSHHPSIVKA